MAEYTLLVTNQTLVPVGDPITVWTQIDVTLRHNEPSSGMFKAPGYQWVRDQIQPGNRVIVIRDGEVLICGPIEKWMWERSDDGDNAGEGMITVDFADYLSLIATRLAYPDPTLTPSAQVADSWTYSGNAELGLRQLVDTNAGESALTERQVPNLVLGSVAGVGSSITASADRMEPLLDVARRMAVAGGNLGFRTQMVGSDVEFQVFAPPDVSDSVVFSFGAGSLRYIAYEANAPTANAAIVGGQGEGVDRYLIEVGNLASQYTWDRREILVNRPGNDPLADLQAAGGEALTEGAETGRVASSAADTPYLQFGTDYHVGWKVSVESWPGALISDVVVTVHIQVYPTAGEVVSPTVGSQAARSDPIWVQRVRTLDRRLAYLERNVLPAVVP